MTERISASTSVDAVADLFDRLDFDLEVFLLGRVAHDPRAAFALEQRLDGAVGQPQQLHHHAERAGGVDVLRAWV